MKELCHILVNEKYKGGFNMETIVSTVNLKKYYGGGDKQVKAVDGVSFKIDRGEFVAVCGKSGSGKSTMLHMLGGLDTPTSGDIVVDGENITVLKEEELAVYRRRKVGFVFQAFNLVPSLNVWENVVLPLGLDNRIPDKSFINDILDTLGLSDKLDSLPGKLSGGQQQRAAIARAIASKPAIILADEPTGNLDSKTGDEVMALLKKSARKYGQTLVIITHDEDIAQTAGRILLIEDGRLASQ
jgi:putative ABC transport system ATP-binding protein